MSNTPKNFSIQLGSLICLYVSLGFFTALLFSLINLYFPDPAQSYWEIERAAETIRFTIAMVIVFFPTYIVLTRVVQKTRRTETDGAYLNLTKWLIYLSLLAAGAVLLGDLVSVIYTFLNGEVTVRFLLKVAAILFFFGLAFFYYLKDVQGYWLTREKQSQAYAITVTLMVMTALAVGFTKIETPTEVREARIDNNQISDLRDIQWGIEEYYLANDELPASIAAVYGVESIPTPPDDRPDYIYRQIDERAYELCATFSEASAQDEHPRNRPFQEKNFNWYHEEGEWCFERSVTN